MQIPGSPAAVISGNSAGRHVATVPLHGMGRLPGRRGKSEDLPLCLFNAFGLKAAAHPSGLGFVPVFPFQKREMMLRSLLIFAVCILLSHLLVAQQADSAFMLPEVVIKADKVSVFSAGIKLESVDSSMLAIRQSVNLASLISEVTGISLRSYSPGGISMLSLRGTTSSQSGVFWNGINLAQANMGATDISRIPVFMFSRIAIQSGGASSLLGSGIMGGSVHLSNDALPQKPLQAAVILSGGSGRHFSGGIKLALKRKNVSYSGAYYNDHNANNFWYSDLQGKRTRLSHGNTETAATIHQFTCNPTARQQYTAAAWYETTDRLIPPTMVMASSDQQQQDRVLRTLMSWKYMAEKQSFTLRIAYIDEWEHYRSDLIAADAHYHLKQGTGEAEYKRALGQHMILGADVAFRFIKADVPYYESLAKQEEISGLLSLAYISTRGRLKSVLNLRRDYVQGYQIPFCPSVNISLKLHKYVAARVSASRNYRVPTMNDRYWVPGGKQDLACEQSWNQEAGIAFTGDPTRNVQVFADATCYNMLIENLIQWLPGTQGIWSPQNANRVWSRGFEAKSGISFMEHKLKTEILTSWQYSPSTYTGSNTTFIDIKGKQLIYIPVNKIFCQLKVSTREFYCLLTGVNNGKKYIINDNSEFLPAYFLLNFDAGKTWVKGSNNIRIGMLVSNVLDKKYQSVQYYPEPGISFKINVEIQLNTQNKTLGVYEK